MGFQLLWWFPTTILLCNWNQKWIKKFNWSNLFSGRYDMYLPVMNCRTCLASWTPEVGDLLCSGYWPGTVGFQTIYQLDLFTSFEDLKINAPGLSRQAFVKMLEQRSQQFGRVTFGRPFVFFICLSLTGMSLYSNFCNSREVTFVATSSKKLSLNGHIVVMKEKNSAALTTSLAQLAPQIQLLCLQMETENYIDSAKQRGILLLITLHMSKCLVNHFCY